MTKNIVAVSFENVLTNFIESLKKWHNETYDTKLTIDDFKTADLHSVLGGSLAEYHEKLEKFYRSDNINKLKPSPGSYAALKSLQRYFVFYVVSTRRERLETVTREWLDRHYAGIFQRLVINSTSNTTINDDGTTTYVEETPSDQYSAKKAMCAEVNATILIDDDVDCISHCAGDLDHSFLFGEFPWKKGKKFFPKHSKRCKTWDELSVELEALAKNLGLEEDPSPTPGPKLSKYRDNTVTVSGKRAAGFYTLLVASKLRSQPVIKLFAIESAISNAVQVSETLKSRNDATATSIITYSGYSRRNGNSNPFRSPRIQITMTRTSDFEKRMENDKDFK